MELNLVGEGLKFMLLGMVIVFGFLIILVQIMKLQASLINKFFPEKAPEAPVSSTTQNSTDEAHHIAAITAAITEFRKKS